MALPPYTEPGVEVIEQFAQALPALALFNLPNVVVGPAFNIVADDDVGAYTGIAADYSYVHQPAGTIVDARPPTGDLIDYPVTANLKNTMVTLLSGTAGVIVGTNLHNFNDATSNVFAGVVAGDFIVITGSLNGNNGTYTVRTVTDNNNLVINETFAAAETGLTYSIVRNVGTVTFPFTTTGVTVSETVFHLPSGLTVTVKGFVGAKPIISSEVHLQYRALRFDKSADLTNYAQPSAIAALQADFGLDQIVPENPVVFGTFLALNQATPSVNLLALDRNFLDTGGGSGDELLSYDNAFSVLALNDIYAISVLTQNPAVHTALKTHVDFYSEPVNKLERVGIINRLLVTTAIVVTSETTGGSEGLVASGYPNTIYLFNYSLGTFITDGVVPGMYLNITAPSGAVGRFLILAVNSQTQLQVQLTPAVIALLPIYAITFFIDKNLTVDEQAATLAAYAQSLGDRRLVMTWPDQVNTPVGNTIRPLPGYFLNVAIGALITGLPTQQGLTNTTVAVYAGVIHSTKYFSNTQLNSLASGGVLIFVQDILNVTPLRIRHQLTTDRSAIVFQELSLTKNVDFVAKFLRTNHQKFIGIYNIVDATIDDLKTFAQRNIKFLKDTTILPRIGGVIKNGSLQSIAVSDVNIDEIDETYLFDFPIPLNRLVITIVASS